MNEKANFAIENITFKVLVADFYFQKFIENLKTQYGIKIQM